MAGIEQMDLGVRIIASKGLGTGGQEKRVILAPNREKRRPPGADVFLEFWIERDIAPVIAEQIELDLGDDLALDFLNSVTALWQEIEWLRNGGGLVAWLEQAHAMPQTWRRIFARTPSSVRLMPWRPKHASDANGSARSSAIMLASHSIQALNELAPLNQLLGRDEPYRGNDRWRRAWRIALATKASLTDA
jgi:hypothetical protein